MPRPSGHTPGLRYWSLIEPYWLPLNEAWDLDADSFVVELNKAPLRIQHLYCGHWCQSEVTNGGLYQFFSNTTGLLAPEALFGFREIGL